MSPITRFIALGLAAIVTSCSSSPPISYEGAIKENAERPDAVPAQEWATSVLEPFWDAQMLGMLESCLDLSFENVPTMARLVVRLDRDRVTVPFKQGTPDSFTNCLSSSVQTLKWPSSPFSKLYFAVEVNTQPPDPSAGEAAAKAIIDAVSRAN